MHRRNAFFNVGVLWFCEVLFIILLVEDVDKRFIVRAIFIDEEQSDVIVVIWNGFAFRMQSPECACLRIRLECLVLNFKFIVCRA